MAFLRSFEIRDAQEREHLFVQALGGFGGRLAIGHQRRAEVAQRFAPIITGFVNAGVGENLVEKNLLRNAIMPGRDLKAVIRQLHVIQKEPGGELQAVDGRHVFNQELHPFALFGRSIFQRAV